MGVHFIILGRILRHVIAVWNFWENFIYSYNMMFFYLYEAFTFWDFVCKGVCIKEHTCYFIVLLHFPLDGLLDLDIRTPYCGSGASLSIYIFDITSCWILLSLNGTFMDLASRSSPFVGILNLPSLVMLGNFGFNPISLSSVGTTSLQNFTHATTIQLSWHVQTYHFHKKSDESITKYPSKLH